MAKIIGRNKGKIIKFSGTDLTSIFGLMLCCVLAITFVLYPYFDTSLSMLYLIMCMALAAFRDFSSNKHIEPRIMMPMGALAVILWIIVVMIGVFTRQAVLLVIVLLALMLTNEMNIRFRGDLRLTS